MRSDRFGLALLAIVTLAIPFAAYSAPWDGSQRLSRMTTVYDVNQLETITGIVEKIYEKIPSTSANRNSAGYHMLLKTKTESIDIHLGPIWYLKSLEGKIDTGDTVQVSGSRAEGHAAEKGKVSLREIRASEVKKGNEVVLKLRDHDGKPLWSNY